MSITTINVGRNNQRYPDRDILAVNGSGMALKQGQVVVLSWTLDGVVHNIIAPSSASIIASHQKAVVWDAIGIAVNATGRVRVQGPVRCLIAASQTINDEDPLTILTTASAGGLSLQSLTVQSVNTSSSLTPAQAMAFVPVGAAALGGPLGGNSTGSQYTVDTSGFLTTAYLIFDGTDVNLMLLNRNGA